ncbi:unnamed protein product [Bemisia tabaci]|uniref:RIIa domain-containing protein n=1 Tax=Bemisia tabaci TaxID=7038 RepID=A0A9P0AD47_BEMTA|nr:unnamed protein product [Bemisia tabaci]
MPLNCSKNDAMVPMNSKYRVNIPLGLESLLEGLAGAVLREQPVDIYRFAAEYFEKLLASRDEVDDLLSSLVTIC